MTIKEGLIEYISVHNLNIDTISTETGISVDKLRLGIECDMNATEFLTLCWYLDVWPECFYEKKLNRY